LEELLKNKQTMIFLALALILFFSGAYSLIYQIAWVRFLTLLLGSTTMGITTVVATFMSGLALGSWLASKYLIGRKNPLKIYALLELIIALTSFITPLLFNWAFTSIPDLLQKFGDANFSIFVLRVLFSAVIMLIPTICMGAALPVLGKYLQEQTNLAERRITIIYGLNTLGASMGCIASGYYLLPGIGLINTIYLTAAANALLPVFILMLPKISGKDKKTGAISKKRSAFEFVMSGKPLSGKARNIILIISATVGFIGLASELVWTRLIILTVGGSIYAYSTILAVYLFFYGIGAALGGASLKFIAIRYGEKVLDVSRTIFFALLLLIPAATTVSIAVANYLPDYFIKNFSIEATTNTQGLFISQLFPAILLMSVATMLSGIFFTYGLFMMKQCADNPAANTSYFYAWNTVGSIAGSVAAAFLLIPHLGLDNTLRVTSTLLIAAGILSAYALSYKKLKAFVITAFACAAVVWIVIPGTDKIALTSGAGIFATDYYRPDIIKDGVEKVLGQYFDLLYYKDGFSASVSVSQHKRTKVITIKTNGKPDGSSFTDMPTQKLIGHLPAFFHPDPVNVCVIGYGTGTTVGSLALHPGITVDAIEIEPAIIEAANYLNKYNNDPLSKENVKLHLTDGRLFLQRSAGKYDMITSEPSNPWLAGVSDLFTLEFYELAHRALNDEGVFGQWIHMYHIQPEAIQLVFRTFQKIFPESYMVVLNPGNDLMLVGCKGSYRPDLNDIKRRISDPGIAADLAAEPVNIRSAYELFSRLLFGPEQVKNFAGEGSLNTDVMPILSYIAPLSLFDTNSNIVNAQKIKENWASNIGILGWKLEEDEIKAVKAVQEEYLKQNFLRIK
jgi:spermidine synthase